MALARSASSLEHDVAASKLELPRILEAPVRPHNRVAHARIVGLNAGSCIRVAPGLNPQLSATGIRLEPDSASSIGADCGASTEVARLLAGRAISLQCGCFPVAVDAGALRLVPDGSIPCDRVVAVPNLRGQSIEGIPQNGHGFVSADAFGRVRGVPDLYAAGDMTIFPIKQGALRRSRPMLSRPRSRPAPAHRCDRSRSARSCGRSSYLAPFLARQLLRSSA